MFGARRVGRSSSDSLECASSSRVSSRRRESIAITQRSKNLLEAFKHASQAAKPAERGAPAPQAAPSAPRAPAPPAQVQSAPSAPVAPRATPVVQPGPASAAPVVTGSEGAKPAAASAASSAAPTVSAPAPTARRAKLGPQSLQPLAVLAGGALLVLVGVFFLGRWSVGAFSSVQAGGDAERPSLESALGANEASPSAEEERAGTAPNAAGSANAALLERPQTLSAADAALLDPANRYTITAISYDANERNLALAKSVAAHFAKRSLPVCTPYQRDKKLFVVVGAAPNTTQLEDLKRAVNNMDSPDGQKGEFASAYITPIDTIVQRKP